MTAISQTLHQQKYWICFQTNFQCSKLWNHPESYLICLSLKVLWNRNWFEHFPIFYQILIVLENEIQRVLKSSFSSDPLFRIICLQMIYRFAHHIQLLDSITFVINFAIRYVSVCKTFVLMFRGMHGHLFMLSASSCHYLRRRSKIARVHLGKD